MQEEGLSALLAILPIVRIDSNNGHRVRIAEHDCDRQGKAFEPSKALSQQISYFAIETRIIWLDLESATFGFAFQNPRPGTEDAI